MKKKRIVLVKGKLFREGFFNRLMVKDWTLVTEDDSNRLWKKWTPLIGKTVSVVAEVS